MATNKNSKIDLGIVVSATKYGYKDCWDELQRQDCKPLSFEDWLGILAQNKAVAPQTWTAESVNVIRRGNDFLDCLFTLREYNPGMLNELKQKDRYSWSSEIKDYIVSAKFWSKLCKLASEDPERARESGVLRYRFHSKSCYVDIDLSDSNSNPLIKFLAGENINLLEQAINGMAPHERKISIALPRSYNTGSSSPLFCTSVGWYWGGNVLFKINLDGTYDFYEERIGSGCDAEYERYHQMFGLRNSESKQTAQQTDNAKIDSVESYRKKDGTKLSDAEKETMRDIITRFQMIE